MTTTYAVEGNRVPEFTIGDRLRKARETAGLSQEQLADDLGVNRRSIVRYEGSSAPKRAVLLSYAMRTGVPVTWLETGKYTPWDLNPEPTVSGFRRRSFHFSQMPFIGMADDAFRAA